MEDIDSIGNIVERNRGELGKNLEVSPVVEHEPNFALDELPKKDDAIIIDAPTSDERCDISVALKPRKGVRAGRFLDMIENGMTPGEAAEKIGCNVKDIIKTPTMQAELKKLIDNNSLPANLQKAMLRAGWNKIFMENVNGNLKQQKVAIAVSKSIARDPDVGLEAAPNVQIGIGVDMGTLGKKLETVTAIPGLEEFIDVNED